MNKSIFDSYIIYVSLVYFVSLPVLIDKSCDTMLLNFVHGHNFLILYDKSKKSTDSILDREGWPTYSRQSIFIPEQNSNKVKVLVISGPMGPQCQCSVQDFFKRLL